jgi:probable HAF family extracellular repeat protein
MAATLRISRRHLPVFGFVRILRTLRKSLLPALGLAVFAMTFPAAGPVREALSQAPDYTFSSINFPGSASPYSPVGINSSGQVVGCYSDSSNINHGFLWSGGQLTTIDHPAPTNGTGMVAINDSGEALGYYIDSSWQSHSFLWSGGQFTPIDPSYETNPVGINNSGQVTGWYWDSSNIIHGFLWSGGQSTTIDPAGATETHPVGINSSGQVAGWYKHPSDSLDHSFLWSGGQFTTIDPTGAEGTDALGIDDSGEVVGHYVGSDHLDHCFLRKSGGQLTTIEPPDAEETTTTVVGINSSGQAFGYYFDSSANSKEHGFLWSGGQYTRIDFPGATATKVLGLNNKGQIVGWYADSSQNPHWFTAIPGGKTYSISGTIEGSKGSSLSGVAMTLSGTSSATTQTGSSGAYSFSGLSNGSYTITPSETGYVFSPASSKVSVNGKNVAGVNFTATAVCSISGTVTVGNNPFPGVTVTLSGAKKASATTNSNGAFSFAGLSNGSYTVTSGAAGYTFSPTSAKVVVNGKNVSGINFTGTAVYSISGTVTLGGNPFPGVTMTLSGAIHATSVKTDTKGAYSFAGLPRGIYIVTPAMSGYAFTPKNLQLTLNANAAGQDFSASRQHK